MEYLFSDYALRPVEKDDDSITKKLSPWETVAGAENRPTNIVTSLRVEIIKPFKER